MESSDEDGRASPGSDASIPSDDDPTVMLQSNSMLSPEAGELTTLTRPKALAAMRSITAPPQLTLRSSPPSVSNSPPGEIPAGGGSSIAKLPPSPPYSNPDLHKRHDSHHNRDTSDLTITPAPDITSEAGPPLPDAEHAPENSLPFKTRSEHGQKDGAERTTPSLPAPSATTEARLHRPLAPTRTRSLSPLPPSIRASTHQHQLTTSLIHKTYAIFLGPPAHLVALMLRIAARLADGVFNLTPSVVRATGASKVPGQWVGSESEDEWGEEEDWAEVGGESVELAVRKGSLERSREAE
ncbi:hypothetical protein B0A49_08627 [Cryomyces minteri]|uniref:Uncharacterized protein n=1 Tax=Cryomyces minteri TaxID=331657 RepID=A0A4U0WTF1_9PEZI|nr:hypothetical protein B0A49_08627 [Cryomyces minteri]